MTSYAAYIDESGNHDLSTTKVGASRYFVVLAVIVEESKVSKLQADIESIRAKHFGPGEIKSSNVKDERRMKILNDLASVDFQFYAVAIDKERIDKDSGLGYKRSFIKFANGKLYSALFHHLINVTIFADAHGSPEFTQSFVQYINDNHRRDLFTNNTVQMVDSKAHVLVQLADFLVGTVAKLYEGKFSSKLRSEILGLLTKRRIRIDEWPPQFEFRAPPAESSNEADATVREISLNSAVKFLERYASDSDIETSAQYAALSYMLFRTMFAADNAYISSQELVEHLTNHGFQDVNKHYIRSNIVSKLRDKDVIIASSPRGYKIPTSYSDLSEFAELVDGIALPLLSRLKRAHGIFDFGSVGKVKILDEPRFHKLQLILSCLENNAIDS